MKVAKPSTENVRKCQSDFSSHSVPLRYVAALWCSFTFCDHVLLSSREAQASHGDWAVIECFFLSPHPASGPRPYSSNSIETPQLLAPSWAFLSCSRQYISQTFTDSSSPLFPPLASISVILLVLTEENRDRIRMITTKTRGCISPVPPLMSR